MQKHEFEQFYNAHVGKVYRFVFFKVAGNKELAEDLVSEVFMKALENFESYDPARGRSAWIFTIAKNHLANYWRDRKMAASIPDPGAEEVAPFDAIWLESAKKEFKKNGVEFSVAELLASLEPREREIVTLHYLFGYNYSEIAQMMNISEAAAKVASHRAIKKLGRKI